LIKFSILIKIKKKEAAVDRGPEDQVQDQGDALELETEKLSGKEIEIVTAIARGIENEEVHHARIEGEVVLTQEDLALLEDQDLAPEIAIIGVKKVIEGHEPLKKVVSDPKAEIVIAKEIGIVNVIVIGTEKERKIEKGGTRIEIEEKRKIENEHLDAEDHDLDLTHELANTMSDRLNQETRSRVLKLQVGTMVRRIISRKELRKHLKKWICHQKVPPISMTGEA